MKMTFRKPDIDLSGGIVGKFDFKCQLDIEDFKSQVYIRMIFSNYTQSGALINY